MSDARWGDPREYGGRESGDERPRVYDERDRDDHDPRDSLMHDLDLPRGEERELVVDRGRLYELNGEDIHTLAAVGTFRVVPEQDLDTDPDTLHHLRDEGLVDTVDLGSDERGRTTSTTSRFMNRSHRPTTGIAVCTPLGRMVERVMILDAVLGDRRCWWLSPEGDKKRFFGLRRENWLRTEDYPHIAFGSGRQRTIRCFPDKLPIGIEKEHTDHVVFLYLVNPRLPVDFRQFLIRHAELFRFLHTWTVRLLVPRRFRKAVALYKAALREELWTPLNPSVTTALETYFPERQAQGGDLGDPDDRAIRDEFRTQGMPKIQALYRAWQRQGDRVLWRAHSTCLRDDRSRGCSAVEVELLNRQYLQLTGTMDRDVWGKRGAKRKWGQVGPPLSTASPDIPSPLVAP